MNFRKYTQADKDRSNRLYEAGLSGPKIEAVTGIHFATAQKWARQAGISRPRSTMDISERDKKEIKELYVKYKHSINQINVMMDIPKWKIFYFLNKHGLMRTRTKARRLRAKRQRLKAI